MQEIPVKEIHTLLITAKTAYREVLTQKLGRHDTQGDPEATFVTANLTFVVADSANSKSMARRLITIPVKVPGKHICNVRDFWDETENEFISKKESPTKIRNKTFLDRLSKSHEVGLEAMPPYVSIPSDTKRFQFARHNKDPERRFEYQLHPSEQALIDFLLQPNTAAEIVNKLKSVGLYPTDFVESVILDIFSTRYVCNKCEIALLSLESLGENGIFLNDLKNALNARDIKTPEDGLNMITRCTTYKPNDSKKPIAEEKHESFSVVINQLGELKNKIILECDINAIEAAVSDGHDVFERTIFMSCIPDAKYLNPNHELRIEGCASLIKNTLIKAKNRKTAHRCRNFCF